MFEPVGQLPAELRYFRHFAGTLYTRQLHSDVHSGHVPAIGHSAITQQGLCQGDAFYFGDALIIQGIDIGDQVLNDEIIATRMGVLEIAE